MLTVFSDPQISWLIFLATPNQPEGLALSKNNFIFLLDLEIFFAFDFDKILSESLKIDILAR